jgi:hypothetical protein
VNGDGYYPVYILEDERGHPVKLEILFRADTIAFLNHLESGWLFCGGFPHTPHPH